MIFKDLIERHFMVKELPYTNTMGIYLQKPISEDSQATCTLRKLATGQAFDDKLMLCTNKEFVRIVDLYLESIGRHPTGNWAAELAYELIDYFNVEEGVL